MSIPLKIYCPDSTSRHQYIFKLIFNELLGVEYDFCQNANDSIINYSLEPSTGLICTPQGLLAESDIRDITIEIKKWDETSCFFKTSNFGLPFDIFSAAFYLVSRYEEYLDYEPDNHSRFPASFSIFTKNNLLEEPLVNQWALKLKGILLSQDQTLKFSPRAFAFKSTIDIDQAWKFKNKGIARSITGTIRDILHGKWENILDRWPVIFGLRDDPFYNFDWQKSIHTKLNIDVLYFVLLGDYGKYDKNINHKNLSFIKLIASLENVGIHPSYQSNEKQSEVKNEVHRLNDIRGTKTLKSRQHFLMHTMPSTYHTLIANGITEEHTMGYSTHLGFRAGIAAPFYWFDLENNVATDLKLIPFCAMDITPLHYRNENPTEAIKSLTSLMTKVKAVDGLFVSLWHNESFSETERWKGWRKVYELLLQESKN
ncbi:polysaccharide deacetylase family protein [Bacteroidia bacterium]|nr:polysaccharide deacetylase family protein [Bacteroidia bacterium]